jgi:hypothetical protein
MGLWQVHPELKPTHPAMYGLWHFLVNNPRPGSHPLDIPGTYNPGIPHAIPVFNFSFKHIGNGLDTAVRMPGEPGKVIMGVITGTEIVKHKERVKTWGFAITECPVKVYPSPFNGCICPQYLSDMPHLYHTGQGDYYPMNFCIEIIPFFCRLTVGNWNGAGSFPSPIMHGKKRKVLIGITG